MKFYPYLLASYPDAGRFSEILDLTLEFADAIEIGIPFTDPVADGPAIANAASHVLADGFRIESVFQLLQKKSTSVPIALMTYANPILAYGRDEFFHAARQCGTHFLIVPDIPWEESAEWREAVRESGMSWISFISLSTSDARLKTIAKNAEGFLYLLSLKGITGSHINNPEAIRNKAVEIRKYSNIPLALGFGIKTAEDAEQYQNAVDAVIVGSRIVEIINTTWADLRHASKNSLRELQNFYETFRRLK